VIFSFSIQHIPGKLLTRSLVHDLLVDTVGNIYIALVCCFGERTPSFKFQLVYLCILETNFCSRCGYRASGTSYISRIPVLLFKYLRSGSATGLQYVLTELAGPPHLANDCHSRNTRHTCVSPPIRSTGLRYISYCIIGLSTLSGSSTPAQQHTIMIFCATQVKVTLYPKG